MSRYLIQSPIPVIVNDVECVEYGVEHSLLEHLSLI